MDIESKLQQNNLLRLKDDLCKHIGVEVGDELILRDDKNKEGKKYIAIWKKGT
jgi:16S rRNA U1498 N3-methylase RsmE